jgi:hypothetical protein
MAQPEPRFPPNKNLATQPPSIVCVHAHARHAPSCPIMPIMLPPNAPSKLVVNLDRLAQLITLERLDS